MSFSERAILWLHIGVAIFTIGPVTAAIMSTPRYIRKRNPVIVGFLYRMTRLYAIASLLLLVFGVILADMLNELSKPWLSISMTLYVVAIVLLILIIRDQRTAVAALEDDAARSASASPTAGPLASAPALTSTPAPTLAPTLAPAPADPTLAASDEGSSANTGSSTNTDSGANTDSGSNADPAESGATNAAAEKTAAQPAPPVTATHAESPSDRIAAVERGRIASLAGVTGLIWLVILILMVWR
jgi:uncharacterized membrane protein